MDKNKFAITPSMELNSWDCYGVSVRKYESCYIASLLVFSFTSLNKVKWTYLDIFKL